MPGLAPLGPRNGLILFAVANALNAAGLNRRVIISIIGAEPLLLVS